MKKFLNLLQEQCTCRQDICVEWNRGGISEECYIRCYLWWVCLLITAALAGKWGPINLIRKTVNPLQIDCRNNVPVRRDFVKRSETGNAFQTNAVWISTVIVWSVCLSPLDHCWWITLAFEVWCILRPAMSWNPSPAPCTFTAGSSKAWQSWMYGTTSWMSFPSRSGA